jgi:hypothetical protein
MVNCKLERIVNIAGSSAAFLAYQESYGAKKANRGSPKIGLDGLTLGAGVAEACVQGVNQVRVTGPDRRAKASVLYKVFIGFLSEWKRGQTGPGCFIIVIKSSVSG